MRPTNRRKNVIFDTTNAHIHDHSLIRHLQVAESKYILFQIILISCYLYIIIQLVCVTCPLNTQHIKEKIKHWLARNQNNVAEWSNMSASGLLFQCASTIQMHLSVLVQYKTDIVIISSNTSRSRHDMVENVHIWC